MKFAYTLVFTLSLFVHSAVSAQDPEVFDQLTAWLEGSFNNANQANNNADYLPYTMEIRRIWNDKSPGAWFYVEQNATLTPGKPSLQRIYFLSQQSDEDFSVDMYTLNQADQFIGAWADPSLFNAIKTTDLKFNEGCSIFMFYDGFQFGGKSNTGRCQNPVEEVAYINSELVVLADAIQIWNRGYSDKNLQLTGPVDGPYHFTRIN